MLPDRTLQPGPTELPEFLRKYRFLDEYGLAVYCRKHGQITRLGAEFPSCGNLAGILRCGEACAAAVKNAVNLCLGRNKPVVFRCRTGLLNFAVPLIPDGLNSYCLAGGAVREHNVDLTVIESAVGLECTDALALTSELEKLPEASLEDVKKTAARVLKIVSSYQNTYLHSHLLDTSEVLLKTVTAILSQMDNCGTAEEAVQLFVEALGILFDLPKAAMVLKEADDNFSVKAQSGMSGECPKLPGYCVRELFLNNQDNFLTLQGKKVRLLFPGSDSAAAFLVPLQNNGEMIGFLALFDAELHRRDMQMVELLIGRLSSKLLLVRKDELHASGKSLADRLNLLVDSISSAKSVSERFRNILKASADILQASAGSLMLIEKNGSSLRIESSIGLNPRIVRCVKPEIGSGISGRVAASGEPILVENIEDDERTGTGNRYRYRFKTKSFVSAPLKVKGKLIGVVNLSDKNNCGAFTGQDLDLLCSVLGHAALALERTMLEERAERLEQFSMVDPVTGLFNRRFLELRLEEELNRSGRHGESLAVMLIELDNFGEYNGTCDGSAADETMKTAAMLLRASSRQMDTVTCISGGRFCIIVPGASRSESFIVAERMRSKIESAVFPPQEQQATGSLTASIGISLYPENGDSVETLMRAANDALERAKIAGCNRVAYSAAGTEASNKVVPLHSALRPGCTVPQ